MIREPQKPKRVRTIALSSLLSDRALVRTIRRHLARIFAPKEAKQRWVTAKDQRTGGRGVRIVDMDDGHLLNTIRYMRRGYPSQGLLDAMVREADRRGLPLNRFPKWLEKRNQKFKEKRDRLLDSIIPPRMDIWDLDLFK